MHNIRQAMLYTDLPTLGEESSKYFDDAKAVHVDHVLNWFDNFWHMVNVYPIDEMN